MLFPAGYQQIGTPALTTAAVASLTLPGGADSATIIVEGAGVRYRDDGVDPTPGVGMPLAAGAVLAYDGQPSRLRFIAQAAGAVLNVAYYRSSPFAAAPQPPQDEAGA
jgi:hypothetical protein